MWTRCPWLAAALLGSSALFCSALEIVLKLFAAWPDWVDVENRARVGPQPHDGSTLHGLLPGRASVLQPTSDPQPYVGYFI